ncbi:uncharacterized protein DNG_04473 [Cephalotrichum gorgonifer]|uniref:AAA+ ATPase domain-containing protein n=1 Tax=Cephalotrichum gorgonifer TaxID=2041049 RepID=A0AAE8SUK4_9PEZI|nr:uncharacterized protein DNG_04473 [Cephalotrichum gorgonifer]
MSDPEIPEQIADLIRATENIIETYDAIKDISGLPEAFHEVAKWLQLVEETLRKMKIPRRKLGSVDDARAIEARLDGFEQKIDKLLEIFQKIAEKSKEKYVSSVYRTIAIKLGKNRVETLMDGILEALAGLAGHHVFVSVLQEQVESLTKAREELAKTPPSLPDSDFEEQLGAAIMYGDGNQQFNAFGGPQTNVSGHYFASRGAQNFGEIHFHNAESKGSDSKFYQLLPFPRNVDIIDRAHVFARLESRLPLTCDDYQSAALYGLGGSGKTQVALEYAYRRCRNNTCSVFWVHAENETTFSQDYKGIAERLGLSGNLAGQKLLAAVRDRIERLPRWLLVFDNADDISLFRSAPAPDSAMYGRSEAGNSTAEVKSLYDYVPLGATGTVLWTSRDQRIVDLVGKQQGIPVSEMSAEEAISLLGTSRNLEVSSQEDSDAKRLIEELQCLPLAISQAGAYMRRTSTPMKEYLSRLTEGKERWRVLKKAEFDRHRHPNVPNSVLETWSISIERIRQDNEMAYNILHTIAYVSNQDIPFEIMAAAGTFGKKQKGKPLENKDLVREAITRLKEFSFLRQRTPEGGGQSYEMHKLVQEATRYGLSARGSKYRVHFSRSSKYGVYFSRTSKYGAYFSTAALRIIAELFPERKIENWAESEKYLAHAVQIGEWAEMSKNEEEVSDLLDRVSTYLFDRGRWREKEPVDERALELRRRVLGENHPGTLHVMGHLATTYSAQGLYGKAELLETRVLELQQQEGTTGVVDLADDSPDTVKRFLQFLYSGNYEDGVTPTWGRPSNVATYSPDTIDAALRNPPGVFIPQGTENAVNGNIKPPENQAPNQQGDGTVEPMDATEAAPSSAVADTSGGDGDDPEYQEYDSDAASTPSREPAEEYNEFYGTDDEASVGSDYDENPRITHLMYDPTSGARDSPTFLKLGLNERNDMFLHLRLYIMADKYDVSALRLLSRDRFYRAAEAGWEVADYFADVVDELYSNTPDTDTAMREIVCRLVGSRIHEDSVREKVTPVMRKHGDFAVGVLNYAFRYGPW